MDWDECIKKRIVKEVGEDANLISSLIKSSQNKIKSSDMLSLSEATSSSKISLAYDSLREILEALAIKSGFKVYNHECYTHFLKEILKESDKGDEFDEIRKIRNGLNYYGKSISVEDAKEVVENIKRLIKYIKDKYFRN